MNILWTRRLTACRNCCLLAVLLASTGCAACTNRSSWLANWWRGGDKAGDDDAWPSATAKNDSSPSGQLGQPQQGGSMPGAVQPVGYTAPLPPGPAAGAAPQQGTSLWPYYDGTSKPSTSATTCTTAR